MSKFGGGLKVDAERRRCACCHEIKLQGEFYVRRCRPDGRQTTCKSCCKQSSDIWRANNKDKVLAKNREWREKNGNRYRFHMINNNLKRDFGITIDEYFEMLESQGGVCAICAGTDKGGRRMSVDHDHKTGKIRAILCGRCNNGLGCYDDDAVLMEKAIQYLRRHAA